MCSWVFIQVALRTMLETIACLVVYSEGRQTTEVNTLQSNA